MDGEQRYPTKQQMAYEALKAWIRDGRLRPGQRIQINLVAKELGVSPIPVREALRDLASEGWVVAAPRRGVLVAQLTAKELFDVLELVAHLEALATQLATPYLGKADLATLRDLCSRQRVSILDRDPVAYARLNREFHFLIRERCPNAALRSVLADLSDRYELLWQGDEKRQLLFRPAHARRSYREHLEIVDAIHDGRPDVARALMLAHKLRTARRVVKLFLKTQMLAAPGVER